MEQRLLKYSNGIYEAEIDITVSEWKEMLCDSNIFLPEYLKMLEYWYLQRDYSATSKEIMTKFNIDLKGTPFNGYVIGLGKE